MSQLDFSVGIGKETVYGTAVAPTRFFEADANFKADLNVQSGNGLRPTKRVRRLRRDSIARRVVSGDINVDALTKGLGFLMNAGLGTSVITQIGATAVWQQNHTLRKDDPVDSFTVQEILPLVGGAGQPHTFTGCVCNTLGIEVKEGAYVSHKTGWLGRDVTTAASATATTYPSGDDLFSFVNVSISIGGTFTAPTTTTLASVTGTPRVDVVDYMVQVNNNLDTKGFNIGGAGLRSRKNVLGRAEVSGKVTVEYTDNVLRDAYLAQTALPVVMTATNGTNVLQVALPSVRLRGEVPASNGGDPITVSVPFDVFDDDTAAEPIWVVYRSTDTAI